MTPPMKPWERAAQNRPCNTIHWNQWSGNVPGQNNSQPLAHPSELAGNIASTSTTNQNGFPPPLPPRPSEVNRYVGVPFNNFGTFSSFSSPPYYYNAMNTGYGFGNRLGYGSDIYGNIADSSFVRLAEESSRPAFQSIQSIVQAVASVSMMLESTYHAVYSSFRAVLGVAEHFSRLKSHLAQILSTLALIRTLNWLCRKILYLLGFIKVNPSAEDAWRKANASPSDSASLPVDPSGVARHRSSWPILMYFGVVLGAPWLIWKLLNSISGINDIDVNRWTTKDDDHYLAVVLYDFQGENQRELSLQAGKEVVLAPRKLQPKVKGWLLASSDGKKTGLVPANYIKVLGFRRGLKHQTLVVPNVVDSCKEKPKDSLGNDLASTTPDEISSGFQLERSEKANQQNTDATDFNSEGSENCLIAHDELEKVSENDKNL